MCRMVCMGVDGMVACNALGCTAACMLAASRGSSRMRLTSKTRAPCAADGLASGLLILGMWVSRDDADAGGGLLRVTDVGAGRFGSLGPAAPSVDGELSNWGVVTPSMSHTNDDDDAAGR